MIFAQHLIMSEAPAASNRESRWPVVISMIILLGLLALSPDRIRIVPVWLLVVFIAIEIIPLIGVSLTSESRGWLKAERTITLIFCVVSLGLNLINLTSIVRITLYAGGEVSGPELLASGIGVWIGNLGSFSLLYWFMDRGGAYGRETRTDIKPDWQFPQEATEGGSWRPVYIDYLFLGYCTATAFSPTDALPLTHRAKLLIMLESTISLLTMAVVLSRSVNILS